MRNHNEELFRQLDSLDAPGVPLTPAETERLEDAVLARVAAPQKKTPAERSARRPVRHLRPGRRLAGVAAAVAVVSACSVTAFALGPALLQMLQGNVEFFEQAPAASQVENAADAPRGDYSALQTSIEAYNAPVGQTAADQGVTITLDTISMDAAGMDVFFTVTGEQAVKGVIDPDDYQPEWDQILSAQPHFWQVQINGKEIAQLDESDFYRVDDDTLKLWNHYLLAETPEGESVNVQLSETYAMGVDGQWNFNVTLDGASVRAGGRAAAPGTYETGGEPLVLERLAFGPVGGVIGAHVTSTPLSGDPFPDYESHGLDASQLYLVDDTGRELTLSKYSARGYTVNETAFYNLTAPDPAATAVTLTPVLWNETGSGWEQRTVSTGELKDGTKIETSPIGGYTVRNFRLEGSAITMELVPYGWTDGLCPELIPDDDGLISLAADTAIDDGQEVPFSRSALCTNSFDPKTGVFTLRFDYYAATEEQLSQISSWTYPYDGGYALDTAHAVTLPLQDIQ